MAAAVVRSSIRLSGCLSSSESQDLTVNLLKTREILFQQALVIEVANTSLAEDQGAKRLLYEDLGVKEYWVLDVKNVRVLAFAIENQGSRRITESNVLPGLQIALLQEALQRTRQTNQSQVVAWLIAEFQRS